MPLLKKKPFERKPVPENLDDDEEVFHCELTNEIFRDYEEFAERTILCNSMVWTCSMTGKSNLTYQEALLCEEKSKKSLEHFPNKMRIPVLFLATKTNRTNFSDMSDDVFTFIKERYFVGETVEATFSGAKWGEFHVLNVIIPPEEELKKLLKTNGSQHLICYPPAAMYMYDLEQVDGEDDDVIEKMIANLTQLRRKKGTITRDKCKLFLKQYVEVNSSGVWVVKKSAIDQFGLDRVSFGDIFAGPLPDFNRIKKSTRNEPVVTVRRAKQETLAKFLKDATGKELKVNAFDDAKKKQEEMDLKRQRVAEEKQKKKEEHLKVVKLLQKWYRPKEDLELEDQKMFPDFTPVKSKIRNKYIGDMFMILEFVNSFSKILHTIDFFPDGFTLNVVERALTTKEVAGPLIDLIQMLLNAIFAQQEEETTHVKIAIEEIKDIRRIPETPTMYDYCRFATLASKFSRKHQGCRLDKLPMYSLTVTEILRLHLLSSGARINESGARWRYQYRGGYSNEDDPGLYMRIHEPHIIRALQHRNVVELGLKNKIKIISCLINQLLTYADVRDVIDERIESSRQQKADLRSAQVAEKKRLTDVNVAKSKVRNGESTAEEIKQKIKKIEQESERQLVEYEKKIEKIKSVKDHVTLLGYDRGFRRYLKLDSIPGIFIDTAELNPGKCLNEPIHQVPELIDAPDNIILSYLNKTSEEVNTSDKENNPTNKLNGVRLTNEIKLSKDLFVCAGEGNLCSVHSLSKRSENPIKFIPSEEAYNELEEALNARGIREKELHKSLEYYQLVTSVKSTPVDLLNGSKEIKESKTRKPDDTNFGYPLKADPNVVMMETLIENILEMEEKLFSGNLGTLVVKDRNHWRKCLSDGNFKGFDRSIVRMNENGMVNGVNKDECESRSSRESSPDDRERDLFRDPGWFLSKSGKIDDELEDVDVELIGKERDAVEGLSIALAQVGLSVDPRCLKKPLGSVEHKKSHPLQKDVLDKWEKSLLASTSFSQIFLHYGTLDSCILWSKSLLLTCCRVCRRRNDSKKMLLCDECNCGYHLYCLKPKLYSIPEGKWFCWRCSKERQKQEVDNLAEVKKKKRKIFRDEDVEEEEVEEPLGKHNENGSDDIERNGDCELCITCGSGGELLTCEKCPKSYHIECIEPPLRRMPRGPWTCNQCKNKRPRHNYRDRDIEFDSDEEMPLASRLTARKEAEDLPLRNVALQDLLSEIIKHKDAWPFVRPVQKNEVPDYYDVISNPMDFGTIKYKLNMGKYTCDEEFMADSVLVFENCNTYNDTDAEVYKCGVRLLKVFRKKSKELGLKLPEEMQDDDDQGSQPKAKKKRTK